MLIITLDVAGLTASIGTHLQEWQISLGLSSYSECASSQIFHSNRMELSDRQLIRFVACPSSLPSLYPALLAIL